MWTGTALSSRIQWPCTSVLAQRLSSLRSRVNTADTVVVTEKPAAPDGRTALLCICNYPANTGYAWDFIESLYAGLASRLASDGIRTYVAYPRIVRTPTTLAASPALPVEV